MKLAEAGGTAESDKKGANEGVAATVLKVASNQGLPVATVESITSLQNNIKDQRQRLSSLMERVATLRKLASSLEVTSVHVVLFPCGCSPMWRVDVCMHVCCTATPVESICTALRSNSCHLNRKCISSSLQSFKFKTTLVPLESDLRLSRGSAFRLSGMHPATLRTQYFLSAVG
jgi:hypothetical protein